MITSTSIDWAASGKAATLLVIAITLFVLAMRKAIRVEREIAEAGKPLVQKNYDHDSDALGFAPRWPTNRLTYRSRQVV